MTQSAIFRQTLAAGVGLGVLAYGLGALALARGPGEGTTYAGSWRVAAVLAATAGLGLAAAGVVTRIERPSSQAGLLAVLAAVAWFAPFLVGWETGPPLVRSLGMPAAGFALPLLVHLVLVFPGSRLRSAPERALVVAAYAEAAVSALGARAVPRPLLRPEVLG